MIKAMEEACQMVLEFPVDEPIDVHTRKLITGVDDAHIELEKVQLELNI